MALNSTGPISFGGATAGQSIDLELGRASNATISMNETAVRTLAGTASGAVPLSAFRGKSNAPVIPPATSGYTSPAASNIATTTITDSITKNWVYVPPTCCAYGNGVFVALGYYSQGVNYLYERSDCMTSSDGGVTWVSRAPSLAAVLAPSFAIAGSITMNDVIWTGSAFFAVGETNIGVTSTDGISWSAAGNIQAVITAANFNNMLDGIASNGAGGLVAVGRNGANAYSTNNGVSWTFSSDALITNYQWLDVCWTGTSFVAVGQARCGYSTTGAVWTQSTNFKALWGSSGAEARSVCWTGSKLIAVGADGTNFQTFCTTSTDGGATWTVQPGLAAAIGLSNIPNRVFWTGTYAIAVGMNGAMATSPDGVTWTQRILPVGAADVNGICMSQSKILLVGGDVGGAGDRFAITTT